MELKYIVMTIIKILISVPTILLVSSNEINGAVLMGGHLDNKSNVTTEGNPPVADYDFYDSQEPSGNLTVSETTVSCIDSQSPF